MESNPENVEFLTLQLEPPPPTQSGPPYVVAWTSSNASECNRAWLKVSLK